MYVTKYMLFSFRYNNILPYDHTRVKLINPLDGCDYLNANWITTAQAKDDSLKRQNGKPTTSLDTSPCSNISFLACMEVSHQQIVELCHLSSLQRSRFDFSLALPQALPPQ